MANFTLEIMISLPSLIPLILAFSQTFIEYRKSKNTHVHYMMQIWLTILIKQILEILAVFFENILLMKIAVLFIIPLNFYIVLFMDYLAKESVEPVKLVVLTALATEVFHVVMSYDLVIVKPLPNGQNTVAIEMGLAGPVAVMGIFSGAFFIYYTYQIHKNAPERLHKYTRMVIISSILMGSIIHLLTLMQITQLIPCIVRWIYGISAILITLAFKYKPSLGFVLPFQVTSIIVIDNKIGSPRYVYSWKKIKGLDHYMFSGLLHGIRSFMKETLDAAHVHEITLDNGHLLLQGNKEHDFTAILYTTKISKTLTDALKKFTQEFGKKYGESMNQDRPLEDFEGAVRIVKKNFWFIPNYRDD